MKKIIGWSLVFAFLQCLVIFGMHKPWWVVFIFIGLVIIGFSFVGLIMWLIFDINVFK